MFHPRSFDHATRVVDRRRLETWTVRDDETLLVPARVVVGIDEIELKW